jgi:carbon-monoxide dehydrogenase small subunit
MTRVPVSMIVNGKEQAEFVESGTSLVDFLRDKLGLYATKVGCQQGTCGSCTVTIDGELSLSCLVPAERANGRNVVTLEGIVPDGGLHPLQRAFASGFASQCGFCSPGMIVAAKSLLDRNPSPSRDDVIEAISGNICRCTGYEPIVNAVLTAAHDMRHQASAPVVNATETA